MKSCKQIKFKKSAQKFLESRTHKEQLRLLSKIQKLPQGDHIRKMEGYESRFRLRIGDVRVIYEMYSEAQKDGEPKMVLVILILEIGSRGDIYK